MQFVCFVPAPAVSIASLFQDASAAWFAGFTARCLGNDGLARKTWQSVLASPTERIAVLRSIYPDDLELARLAAQAHPADADAHFWLGDILFARQDYTAAIPAYESALALRPEVGVKWQYLGMAYEKVGDPQQAVRAYDQACANFDRGKNGCLGAGRLHLAQGEYAQALDSYQHSLRQLPGFPASLRGVAEALLALERENEAIPYLDRIAASGDAWAQQTLQEIQTGQK